MKRWGRVSWLLAVGIFVGAGCGGRTSALTDGFASGADGSGADGSGAVGNGAGPSMGGGSSTAGKPSRAGGPSVGGNFAVGGSIAVGGGYPGGPAGGTYAGGAYPIGGSFPYPYGGGYPTGGAFPGAGTGYGGNPMQPGGACCDAGEGPSCRPRAVANCVCASVPYCCDELWVEGCARLVEPLGCGYCERFDCESCLNRACGELMAKCFADVGCASIYSCVRASGCEAFQCYSDDQCRGVIDAWGGPGGYSMGLLLQAFACSVRSGCGC